MDQSHLVPKAAGEKGRQPSAGPAKDVDDEGSLDPVALWNKDEIIFCPKSDLDACESSNGKVILRSMLVNHHPLRH